MTSLLPPLRSPSGSRRSSDELATDLAHRRPLVATALIGGLAAAGCVLAVVCAVALVGWFLTGSGAFGQPGGAVHAGAVTWLVAQGSGVHVAGTAIGLVPLGLTVVIGWALWRAGVRVGDSVSGHGPDPDRIADGERDWTVLLATAVLAVAYGVAVAVVGSLSTSSALGLDVARATVLGFLLAALVGGAGVAHGSGRAEVILLAVPPTVRLATATGWRILRAWLILTLLVFVLALALDAATAANILSQLGTDTSSSALLLASTLLVLPNAMAFTGSYLLGPGFALGAGTAVAPSGVVLGPLPMVPTLAALPDVGTQPAWASWLVLLPVGAAVWGVVSVQRRHPTTRWDEALIRGLVGGVGAGLAFGLIAHWSGGAIGPGRMADVGVSGLDVTVRAVVSMGLGGLAGAAATTVWQRRSLEVA